MRCPSRHPIGPPCEHGDGHDGLHHAMGAYVLDGIRYLTVIDWKEQPE